MAIYIIGKLKQKNNGKFALLDAADIEMPDGTRLSEYLSKVFTPITQEEYNKLVEAETVDLSRPYFIKKETE